MSMQLHGFLLCCGPPLSARCAARPGIIPRRLHVSYLIYLRRLGAQRCRSADGKLYRDGGEL